MTIFNIGSVQAVRIVTGDGDDPTPVTVFNRDLLNIVLVGEDSTIGSGVAANANSYSLLDPLATLSYDGTMDVWASTLVTGTTAMVDVVPGVTGVSVSPALIASQIAAVGVFNTNNAAILLNQSSAQSLPAGGTTSYGPFTISRSSYEIAFSIVAGVGCTVPFLSIDMMWTDSLTGQICGRERWFPAQGTNPGGMGYFGTGPTKGDTLNIMVTNQELVHASSLSFLQITQSSRTVPRDDWRQNSQPNLPTFASGTYEQAGNVLMATAPSIGAGSSTNRIMPLYCGLVNVAFVPPSGIAAPGGRFVINDEGAKNTSAVLAALTVAETNDSVNSQNFQCYLPRAVCSMSLFNDSAGAGTFSASIQIAETPA